MNGDLTGEEQVVVEIPTNRISVSVEGGNVILENTDPSPILLSTESTPVYVSISPDAIDGQFDANAVFEYVHSEGQPNDIWIVNHNLKKFCSVTVVDSGGNVVIGDVKYNSSSQITLTFSSAFSGKAYLN